MSVLGICRSLLLGSALLGMTLASAAPAKHYQVLHSFNGNDGAFAAGDLQLDKSGNLYGTTAGGGDFGDGTIFKLSAGGTFSLMYSFTGGADGRDPEAGLILDPSTGDLYGASTGGGSHGQGGIFRLTAAGAFSVLHDFDPDTDGDQPDGAFTRDKAGNMYGTASYEGPIGGGTVFKVSPDGTFTVLHAFAGREGAEPVGRLALHGSSLYGIATVGGSGSGTLFKAGLDGTFAALYSFNGGVGLSGGPARDSVGNLYGGYASGENGLIYALSPQGTLSTFYTFTGGADGRFPYTDMLLTPHGKLYGTTVRGGAGDNGTIFKLDLQKNFTLLHSFTGAPNDGAEPSGGLVKGRDGKLYGTTLKGGSHDKGVIFSVTTK